MAEEEESVVRETVLDVSPNEGVVGESRRWLSGSMESMIGLIEARVDLVRDLGGEMISSYGGAPRKRKQGRESKNRGRHVIPALLSLWHPPVFAKSLLMGRSGGNVPASACV